MQFKGKLMNETWEKDKKPNFALDFDPFGPSLSLKTFFGKFYLH